MSTIEELKAEIDRLKAAIREHRDERGDDRCWLDDERLYDVLGEGEARTELPAECEFIESCRRFWRQRQKPFEHGGKPGAMTIGQLEREVERLRQLVCDFQAAALIDVGNQGDPCLVEPRHVEAEVTRLRNEVERLNRERDALLRAALVPMWSRWSYRLGRLDPMAAWDTDEEALAALKAALAEIGGPSC